MVTSAGTIGVRSLGLEMELDSHLMVRGAVMCRVMLLMLSQSALILRLCSKWSLLYGDHGGCVGVNEAGQGVVRRGGGGGVRVLRSAPAR